MVHYFNRNSFARSAYMHSLGIFELICSGRIQNEVWRLEETEERGRLNARNRTLPLASIRLEAVPSSRRSSPVVVASRNCPHTCRCLMPP